MILCPNCKHEELDGAIFCLECGSRLVGGTDPTATQAITANVSQGLSNANIIANAPVLNVKSWGTLHLLESGQLLPLIDQMEYTLGRGSDDQPVMPDIDLTPYRAFEFGVSRLHAVIKKADVVTVIKDLGSSNGTFLNGNRLTPNNETRIQNGDVITLGKLKIQVLLTHVG